jgi:hypothetical protein
MAFRGVENALEDLQEGMEYPIKHIPKDVLQDFIEKKSVMYIVGMMLSKEYWELYFPNFRHPDIDELFEGAIEEHNGELFQFLASKYGSKYNHRYSTITFSYEDNPEDYIVDFKEELLKELGAGSSVTFYYDAEKEQFEHVKVLLSNGIVPCLQDRTQGDLELMLFIIYNGGNQEDISQWLNTYPLIFYWTLYQRNRLPDIVSARMFFMAPDLITSHRNIIPELAEFSPFEGDANKYKWLPVIPSYDDRKQAFIDPESPLGLKYKRSITFVNELDALERCAIALDKMQQEHSLTEAIYLIHNDYRYLVAYLESIRRKDFKTAGFYEENLSYTIREAHFKNIKNGDLTDNHFWESKLSLYTGMLFYAIESEKDRNLVYGSLQRAMVLLKYDVIILTHFIDKFKVGPCILSRKEISNNAFTFK